MLEFDDVPLRSPSRWVLRPSWTTVVVLRVPVLRVKTLFHFFGLDGGNALRCYPFLGCLYKVLVHFNHGVAASWDRLRFWLEAS